MPARETRSVFSNPYCSLTRTTIGPRSHSSLLLNPLLTTCRLFPSSMPFFEFLYLIRQVTYVD